jgi:hypothetical protein
MGCHSGGMRATEESSNPKRTRYIRIAQYDSAVIHLST